MSTWNKIMECVPNFSEGRDLEKIDKIVAPFRAKTGVKLLDYSNDEDHNRLVVTVVGEPVALKQAVLEAIGVAVELIDLNKHSGQHPRMGAVDVVPFIPIRRCTMEEAIALSKEVGEEVGARYAVLFHQFFGAAGSRSQIVTGPSFVSETSMWAPNMPVSTGMPSALSASVYSS